MLPSRIAKFSTLSHQYDRILSTSFPLVGKRVRLELLSLSHVPALTQIALKYPAVFEFTFDWPKNEADMSAYVQTALQGTKDHSIIPLATICLQSGCVIGSTRFSRISWPDKHAEIGWTWLSPEFQRTGANREAKFLQLKFAFEELKFNRIEFRTDSTNAQSRKALEGIGATYEGTFRKHLIMKVHNNRRRDTAVYSIIDEDWPTVKEKLQQKLNCNT